MINRKPTFTLGTAVSITTTLSMDTPDSVKITIKDSNSVVKVDSATCTRDSARVYSYIYQSLDTDTEGTYMITIKAQYAQYVAKSADTFELRDADAEFEEEVGMSEV